MLASDIVTPIRRAISDEKAAYRHDDAELLSYIGDGLVELNSRHPEAFITDDIPVDPPAAPVSLLSVVDMNAIYKSAIVHFVAAKVLTQDSEDEGNAKLAQFHWAHWKEELQ